MNSMSRPQILVLSFSPLMRDARVLRQLSVVAEFGDITTCGYGPATPYSTHHVEIPAGAASLPQTPLGVACLALHCHRASDLAAPGTRAVIDDLRARHFDAVIANDARALPLAYEAAQSAPIWADLHEWAPEERTHVAAWRILIAPWIDSVCERYLPRVANATTVGTEIMKLYERRYGVRPQLMRNAAPFADLTPSTTPTHRPLRIVHSGAAVPGRSLKTTIDATLATDGDFSLDLYVVPGGDKGAYLKELKARASGSDLVRFHDPVAPADLPATLNAYDIGAFWMPPVTTNARLTLPNKFFDFVQARLALAIGPSIEMTALLEEHELGVISAGYEVPQIVDSLRQLTPEVVDQFKQASHTAAPELCFEKEAEVARGIMRDMLGCS